MMNGRNTDDLIRELSAAPVPVRFSSFATIGGMAGLLVGVLALYFAGFGLRPDLFAAWENLLVQAKTLLPALLCPLAIWLALGSSTPVGHVALWPLLAPVVLAFALFLLRFAQVDGALGAEILGKTALACLGSITMLSALPLAFGVFLFRRAAPTRPVLAGALLGIATGAGVTTGYSLHCTEDSPLFFVVWYGLAIVMTGGFGALLGHRFLRW